MKRFAMCIILIAAAAPFAPGQQAVIPPPDQDPFVGQWRANAGESRPRLGRKEASYERTIQRDGDNLIFASSGGASKATVRQFKIRCDGLFHSLPTGPILSCRYASPTRVEGETGDPTAAHSFWTREVSSDGQRMTVSSYKNKGRTKVRSVMVLDRVK
jgi:Tol biopolymer transport system component